MTVKTNIDFNASVKEEVEQDLGTARLPHTFSFSDFFPTGATASKFDVVYSKTVTAAGAAEAFDVLGTLLSELDSSVLNFVTLCGVFVVNKSSTSTESLLIGGGANPVAEFANARELGPGGLFVWFSPIDGTAPVAATGDIITIDPGPDTITFDIMLLGRSA